MGGPFLCWLRLAGVAVSVSVELVDIGADDARDAVEVARTIAASASAVNIDGVVRNARVGVVRVAAVIGCRNLGELRRFDIRSDRNDFVSGVQVTTSEMTVRAVSTPSTVVISYVMTRSPLAPATVTCSVPCAYAASSTRC